MFNWRLLVSPGFWFSAQWNPVTAQTIMLMASVFGLLIVAGAAVLIVAGRHPDEYAARYLRRVSGPLFLGGILGEFLTLFLWQQIPVLSARFWYLFLFIAFAVWMYFAVRGFVVQVPKQRAAARTRDEFRQYLPKRKKK